MNHRELVLSARKKAKFGFLALPEELQDEIVDGLDNQALTLEAASALVKSRGHSLSHEAIAGYYRAVRTERRLLEVNQELSRVVAEYADKPFEEGLKSLANLIIATAATGLAAGDVGVKDIDLAKVLKALPALQLASETAEAGKSGRGETGKVSGTRIPTADEIKRLREQFL